MKLNLQTLGTYVKFLLLFLTLQTALSAWAQQNNVLVQSIQLEEEEIRVRTGASFQIKATALPAEATDRTLAYKSNNENVVRVDQQGNCITKNSGVTTITVSTTDGSNISREVKVRVLTLITNIKLLDGEKLLLRPGAFFQLRYQITPDDFISIPSLAWESSDTAVVTVNEEGQVMPLKVGKATVSVYSVFDRSVFATIEVEVIIPVEQITIVGGDRRISVGDRVQLTALTEPEEAPVKDVTWTSDNPQVASVDYSTGRLLAKGVGTAVITARSADEYSGVEHSIRVTVDATTGLAKVTEDLTKCRFYTLKGERIYDISSLKAGIYIKVSGDKTEKVEVKP